MEVGEENRHWHEPNIPNIALIKPRQFDVFSSQPPDQESDT